MKYIIATLILVSLLIVGCGESSKSDNISVITPAQATPVVKEVIKHDTVSVIETEYLIPGPFRSGGKDSTMFQFGGTGYLEFETRYDGPYLAIWPTKEMSGGTMLAGSVETALKVKLVNSTLNSIKPEELLAALHGKLVTVTGTMKCTGRGEGSTNVFKSVEILIHPRWQAEGRWPSEGE